MQIRCHVGYVVKKVFMFHYMLVAISYATIIYALLINEVTLLQKMYRFLTCIKDVRAQMFLGTDFFFTLATLKGNDQLLLRKQKMGGHRLRFGENMPRKIP